MLKYNPKIIPLAKELRKKMTKQEKHLWYDFLKNYPVNFQRQKTIGQFIADFYCAKARLVIELDGSEHYTDEGKEKDLFRTFMLEKQNLTVLRFSNLDVTNNFEGVCITIDKIVKQTLQTCRTDMQ